MKQRFMAIYIAGIVAEILLRLPYDRQRRQIPKTDQRVNTTEQALLGGLFVGNLVLPLVYGGTRWFDSADYPLSPPARARAGGLGSGLLATAIWLFWHAHHDLGANWSPSLEIGVQHTLVTGGVTATSATRCTPPTRSGAWPSSCCCRIGWPAGPGGRASSRST